jgi:AcrR family transcriptional regulator
VKPREVSEADAAARTARLRRRRAERATPPNTPPWSMRLEILKSAASAFRRLGYHGATVEHIATALRMKKGNLYYYFRNKEEILFACHQYSLDKLLAILDQIEQREGSADDKLRALIDAFVHTILDELQGTALLLDLEALSPMHRRAVIARRDRFDRGLRRVLEQGVSDGTFGALDVKLLSFAILGAVNWIPRWYQPDGPSTSQDIADRFADFLIGGLRSL